MADIVRMETWLSRQPRRESARRETPAEILLFTGVRYERLTPAMIGARSGEAGPRGKNRTPLRSPAPAK